MAEFPKSDGWWYIPKINKLFYVETNHIMILYDNYKDFGITEEELDNWHKKWNIKSLYNCDNVGIYDEKENELINLAFKKGAYKLKETGSVDSSKKYIIIEYDHINKKELLDFLLLNKKIFEGYIINLSCIKDEASFNNIEEAIEYYDN